MNEKFTPFLLDHYTRTIVLKICNKYGMTEFEALRSFLASESYRMLCNPAMAMWEISAEGVFDMWENEKITGNPRNSLYIRRN